MALDEEVLGEGGKGEVGGFACGHEDLAEVDGEVEIDDDQAPGVAVADRPAGLMGAGGGNDDEVAGPAGFQSVVFGEVEGALAGKGEEEFGMRVCVQGVGAAADVFVDTDVAEVEFHALGAEVDGAEPALADIANGLGGPGLFAAIDRDAVDDPSARERGVAVVVDPPGLFWDAIQHGEGL